ncbi:MAG: class I SAM-dependent methyltransferase [Betaproteobacteria bacterium]|nr:class I SAM-dependent methyltransferase [Betaproteobacteria bacterium]MDH3438870.1 class I SAM-dependent methyltransferase [Betaproteobacteria bacterium]
MVKLKCFPVHFSASLILVVLLAASAVAQTVNHHLHPFGDAEKWAEIFDDPGRDEWQKPDEVLRALALAPDAKVADIGAGTGYFAVRLARAVPQGHVYGVDAEHDMVRYLGERASRENLGNLSAVLAKPDDPGIPVAVDLVILVDTYHHIPDRERYFRALQKSFKTGGRLAIIDFTLESPIGPSVRSRIPVNRVKQELSRAGYRLLKEHKFLPNQYYLVFRPETYR